MGEVGFKCCPYGRVSAAPIFLAYGALGLIATASYSCHFYEVTDMFQQDDNQESSFAIGLWRLESVDSTGGLNVECDRWTSHSVLDREDMDASMHFARFVSMTTVMGGLVLSFVLLGVTCCTYPTWLLKSMSIASLIGGFFSILTMVALSSKFCQDAEACQLGYAGILAIASFFLWICTGVVLFLLTNKRSTGESRSQPAQVVPVLKAESFEYSENSLPLAGSKIIMDLNHLDQDGSTVSVEDMSSRDMVLILPDEQE